MRSPWFVPELEAEQQDQAPKADGRPAHVSAEQWTRLREVERNVLVALQGGQAFPTLERYARASGYPCNTYFGGAVRNLVRAKLAIKEHGEGYRLRS